MNHPQPYPPPLSPIPEDPLLGNPCDPCDPRRPMNPLAGIWAPHRTTLGYREASPDGDDILFVLEGIGSAHHQQTAHHSLLTANLPADFLAPPAHPILNSSFLILNWFFTFSAKERDPETGLSYFGSRYYSSDLSVWLSVDPMAAKYPSWSPYVYCANNPVKLVDPEGEAWETEADEKMANSMIIKATEKINELNTRIDELYDAVMNGDRSKKTTNELDELIHQKNFLQEGVGFLSSMEKSSEKYHFNELETGNGSSCKQNDGTVNINYVDMAMAWHECVHIGDSKLYPNLWSFGDDGCLGTTDENFAKAEYHAYKSQFSFDSSGFIFLHTKTKVTNLSKVIDWVKSCGFDQPLNK